MPSSLTSVLAREDDAVVPQINHVTILPTGFAGYLPIIVSPRSFTRPHLGQVPNVTMTRWTIKQDRGGQIPSAAREPEPRYADAQLIFYRLIMQ
jgi:hypothetical protein